jgi:2-desacetyl-2-hydroxyethyl bacteriochlorophyllide A dehydrogenase
LKAAIIYEYGSPDVFRIEEIEKPVIDSHEVLIKVHAASINPVDWKQRQGWHKLFLKAHFPVILGYDVAGEIVECGADVKDFHSGDKVYTRLTRRFGGAFAEYAAASESALAIKPDQITWEQAAAVPLAGITALQGLRDKCRLKKGESILVIGAAGGVGHFALQIAKQMGASVTAVCSGRHQKMMKELKPDHYIDYKKNDYKLLPVEYDVIFDAAGVDSFRSCRHILKLGGRYVTTLPRPKLVMHILIAFLTSSKKVKTFLMKSKGDDLKILSEMITENKLKIFIDSVFPLEKIADAHRRAEEYTTEGKIVVKILE